MIVKYLNWVLVASCAAFLMFGTYSKQLTKVCIIIAVVAFILLSFYSGRRLFFKNLFGYTVLNKAVYCSLIIAVLSTIFGISPYRSQQVLFNRYIIYFAVFFIGAFLGKSRLNVNILILALLSGAFLVSMGGIVDLLKVGDFPGRVYTSFGSSVSVALFLYALPFFIGFIFFQPLLKPRIYCAIAAIPVLLVFILHGSRAGWIGFLFSVAATCALVIKKRFNFLFLALAFILLLFLMPLSRVRVIQSMSLSNFDCIRNDSRFQLWTAAVNIFKDFPILGAGPGNYGDLMQNFSPEKLYDGTTHMHAHNTYLEVLAEMGILGLMSFLWIFVLFFKVCYRSIRGSPNAYNISFMIMFVGVAVSELFVSTILVGVSLPVVFWFLLGMGVVFMDGEYEIRK